MQAHHYLGSLAKIGETLWYVATYVGEWVALLSFSSAALKCAARDRWIGWNFRHQYSRLNLLTNNSRFLILPAWHYPNLASKTLSLCLKRLSGDWQTYFGHPLLLVETFVDPARFQGTLYKASNWLYLGDTQGFSRTRLGYSATRLPQRLRCCLLFFCKPMPASCCHVPFSNPFTKPERQNSCYPPKKCTHSTISLPTFPTPAALRDAVIRCPRY
jgi:hypothetical protein